MREPCFARETLPERIAAVAARSEDRIAVIVSDALPETTAHWAGGLAFSRMTESLGGVFGLVTCEEIPVLLHA
jgi:hypothetical protein